MVGSVCDASVAGGALTDGAFNEEQDANDPIAMPPAAANKRRRSNVVFRIRLHRLTRSLPASNPSTGSATLPGASGKAVLASSVRDDEHGGATTSSVRSNP
ncbi:hypothetical protein GCM10027563_05690 [Parasphingorhabdus pacifica]